jgi:hypothetical protein
MRVRVRRLLLFVVLATGLAITPALRAVCYDSCAVAAGQVSHQVGQIGQMVTSHDTPDCHEHEGDGPQSAPLGDDCGHPGESFRSGLSVSVKSVGSDGAKLAQTATASVSSPVDVSHGDTELALLQRQTPAGSSHGQSLGLFLTPLRI